MSSVTCCTSFFFSFIDESSRTMIIHVIDERVADQILGFWEVQSFLNYYYSCLIMS